MSPTDPVTPDDAAPGCCTDFADDFVGPPPQHTRSAEAINAALTEEPGPLGLGTRTIPEGNQGYIPGDDTHIAHHPT